MRKQASSVRPGHRIPGGPGQGRQGQEEARRFPIQRVLGHRGVTGSKHLQNRKSRVARRPCTRVAARCGLRVDRGRRRYLGARSMCRTELLPTQPPLWPAALSERLSAFRLPEARFCTSPPDQASTRPVSSSSECLLSLPRELPRAHGLREPPCLPRLAPD